MHSCSVSQFTITVLKVESCDWCQIKAELNLHIIIFLVDRKNARLRAQRRSYFCNLLITIAENEAQFTPPCSKVCVLNALNFIFFERRMSDEYNDT